MSQRKVYHVTPAAEGGWQVKDEQEERAASTHEKKDEAVARAKCQGAREGPGPRASHHPQAGRHDSDGYTYGDDPSPPAG